MIIKSKLPSVSSKFLSLKSTLETLEFNLKLLNDWFIASRSISIPLTLHWKIKEEKILRIPLPDPISRIELMGLVKKELSFVFSNIINILHNKNKKEFINNLEKKLYQEALYSEHIKIY